MLHNENENEYLYSISLSLPNIKVRKSYKHHWIEFFGLFGEIKYYDALVREKQKLARKYKLPLVKLYPKDLFSVSRLSEKLLG